MAAVLSEALSQRPGQEDFQESWTGPTTAAPCPLPPVLLTWGLLSQQGLWMGQTEQQHLSVGAGKSQEAQPGQERSLEGETRSVLRLAAFRAS